MDLGPPMNSQLDAITIEVATNGLSQYNTADQSWKYIAS